MKLYLFKETQKWNFCHDLLTLTLSQPCLSFFLLLNTEIFKTLPLYYFCIIEVSGYRQLITNIIQNIKKYEYQLDCE